MQRRAAAAYFAFFLVLAAGSYAVIATAQPPATGVTQDEAQFVLTEGTEFTVNGQTFTTGALEASESSGGGHGGGGGVEYAGSLEWTNQSATWTSTWEHNATITLEQGENAQPYRVLVGEGQEGAPTSALLRPDPPEDLNPRWVDGRQVVDYDVDGDGRVEAAIPVGHWIADQGLQNRTVALDDTIAYQGNESTVTEMTNTTVTVQWTAPRVNTIELSQASNVTIGGEQFFVYFAHGDDPTQVEAVYLTTPDQTQFFERESAFAYFEERINGFWGVTILGAIAAIFVAALAYLPSKH